MTPTARSTHRLPLTHLDHISRLYPGLDALADDLYKTLQPQELGFNPLGFLDLSSSQIYTMGSGLGRISAEFLANSMRKYPGQTIGRAQIDAVEGKITRAALCKLNFIHSGKLAYHISEKLTPLVLDTELNVLTEDFELPSSGCVFVFDDAEMYQAASVSINEPDRNGRNTITAMLSFVATESGTKSLILQAFEYDGPVLKYEWIRDFPMQPGRTLEQELRGPLSDALPDPALSQGWFRKEGEQGDSLRFWRAIINSALYITSRDPDLSTQITPPKPAQFATLPKKQRIALESQAKGRSRITYFHVGGNLPEASPERTLSAPSDEKGRAPLSHRFRVIGHYKYQAHGPGRSERTRIWIKPFWKGPDAAEVLTRSVVVTAGDMSPGI